ncbi:hypothetical protein J6590_051645 [Homalodisca vitripennis]|nr:hypothetical protein J6590_051645 [Homalodisca vitripennis]
MAQCRQASYGTDLSVNSVFSPPPPYTTLPTGLTSHPGKAIGRGDLPPPRTTPLIEYRIPLSRLRTARPVGTAARRDAIKIKWQVRRTRDRDHDHSGPILIRSWPVRIWWRSKFVLLKWRWEATIQHVGEMIIGPSGSVGLTFLP